MKTGETGKTERTGTLPDIQKLLNKLCYLSLIGIMATPATHAAPPQDGLYWLGRVVGASREQNYTGVFVYRHGGHGETSRITHKVSEGRELERLEVLDGSPREVIRDNDEVKCYLPESRTLIVEKKGRRTAFPMILPTSLAGLSEHYNIRKGPVERIAGRDSQTILLEPRDALRYGHKFWVDVTSGLLLKAGMLNEKNESVETFAFTQLQVGGEIDRDALKSRFDTQSGEWHTVNLQATRASGQNEQWLFKVQLPGFRKIADMRRNLFRKHKDKGTDGIEATHIVFSDGIASISVFIEPQPSRGETGETAVGTLNIYRRILDDQLILVMGEVPRATLKTFGDGIERRSKP